MAVFFRISWLFVLLSLVGCRNSPERSFYYWKTTFTLSAPERKCIALHRVTKLYIRFFDVDWDQATGQIVPVGRIFFRDSVPTDVTVIPTVYLVNKTLQKITSKEIYGLSKRILGLVNSISETNHFLYSEIQLDCDWTETTRDKYFAMINILRTELKKSHKTLSATIRLHQVKYAKITGIPPVERGMLMYYNIGKIDAGFGRNSVFNATDAAKYTDYIADYPLPLDVALPSFSWGIHIRNKKVIELLNNMGLKDFKNNDNFTSTDPVNFRANYSFFFRGFYFKKNDCVKVEEISPQLCKEAARQVNEKMVKKPVIVAIFHLDSTIISHYEERDFEEVFDSFR